LKYLSYTLLNCISSLLYIYGRRLSLCHFLVVITLLTNSFSAIATESEFLGKRWFWQPHGHVRDIESYNGKTYVTGGFSHILPDNPNFAIIDSETGKSIAYTPLVRGIVRSAISLQSGGWIIAGEITSVDGFPVFNIAKINANGSLDKSFIPAFDRPINTIVINENVLYVGGEFEYVNNKKQGALVAIDLIDGSIINWNPTKDRKVVQYWNVFEQPSYPL